MVNWPNLTYNKINMKQNFLRGSLFCDLIAKAGALNCAYAVVTFILYLTGKNRINIDLILI